VARTQMQLLVNPLADAAGLRRRDARRALVALDGVVRDELGNVQKVRIGGVVPVTVRAGPARKARTGRDPTTGEQGTIVAQPASVDVRGVTADAGGRCAVRGTDGPPPARHLDPTD